MPFYKWRQHGWISRDHAAHDNCAFTTPSHAACQVFSLFDVCVIALDDIMTVVTILCCSSHALTSDIDIKLTAHAAELFLSDGVIVTGSSTGSAADLRELTGEFSSIKNSSVYLQGTTHCLCVNARDNGYSCLNWFRNTDLLSVRASAVQCLSPHSLHWCRAICTNCLIPHSAGHIYLVVN